jgi:predicted HicB family RNase H-like nuclease
MVLCHTRVIAARQRGEEPSRSVLNRTNRTVSRLDVAGITDISDMIERKGGAVPKAAEINAMSVRMPQEVHEGLRTFSQLCGKSMNDIAVQALREYLTVHGRDVEVDRLMHEALDRHRVTLDKLADL